MTKAAEWRPVRLVKHLVDDLAPFPGRLAITWRVSVLTALVAAVAMSLQTPEVAVSCYLVTFVMKPDSSASVVVALTLTFVITVVIALATILTVLTIGSPGLRLLLMATVSFTMLFLGSASKLGPTGGVVALIVADILSLIYTASSGEIITEGLRFAWELVALPMMMIVAFNILLGRSTVAILRDNLLHRLVAVRDELSFPSTTSSQSVRELLQRGNAEPLSKLKFVRLFRLVSSKRATRIEDDITASYQLLLATSAMKSEEGSTDRQMLFSHVGRVVEGLKTGQAPPPPPPLSDDATPAASAAYRALAAMAGQKHSPYRLGTSEPFFASDAFRNPEHVRYALKTTAAAMTCYVLYAGINWAGIHTAMITCYVVSLRTTGETIQKLGMRILGCLIGAAMGLLSIVFLIPHMHSIGHLMLLVFAGTFIAAWITNGVERTSYAGIQVGLAFFLSVLQGFAPGIDLELARDRTIGILLGNTVMYLVATRIWPIGTEYALRTNLSKALKGLASLALIPTAARGHAAALTADIGGSIGAMRKLFSLLPLEPASVRPTEALQSTLRLIAEEAEMLSRQIYLARSDTPDAAERLRKLADQANSDFLDPSPINRETEAKQPSQPESAPLDPIDAQIYRMEILMRDVNR
ncbi:FUSC family protein (plasmid) [Sinorhizobium sp. B11]